MKLLNHQITTQRWFGYSYCCNNWLCEGSQDFSGRCPKCRRRRENLRWILFALPNLLILLINRVHQPKVIKVAEFDFNDGQQRAEIWK